MMNEGVDSESPEYSFNSKPSGRASLTDVNSSILFPVSLADATPLSPIPPSASNPISQPVSPAYSTAQNAQSGAFSSPFESVKSATPLKKSRWSPSGWVSLSRRRSKANYDSGGDNKDKTNLTTSKVDTLWGHCKS